MNERISIKIGHIEMQGLTRSVGRSGRGDRRRGQGERGNRGNRIGDYERI
jgi:hypothetical protein